MVPVLDRSFSIREEKNTISVDREIENSVENRSGVESCRWMPASLGTGFMRVVNLKKGMNLFIEDLNPRKNFLSSLSAEQYPMRFMFTINGNIKSSCKISGTDTVLDPGMSQIDYMKLPVDGSMEKMADTRSTIIILMIEPEVFFELVGNDFEEIPWRLRSCLEDEKKSGCTLTANNTAVVSSVLYEILSCPYSGLTRRLFLEGKATELIALQLNSLKEVSSFRTECPLPTKEHIDKIYRARDTIVKDIENPPGLVELSKMIGISHSNLNKGFRQIFNTTVFGYLREARLEKARKLLLEGDMNVTEAAYAVGYSSLSHFSLAFREYTGVKPGEIRQNKGFG